ncbi:MAG: endonuclease/exonuclease/phosphatase family protein [Nocardioidaceae bacterium]|nr:endonuclease/exonuclease/phosphatase family protein [Nocardioidaceae bacterium]NUS49800.1 endonuclease/exonuclease/phosphatase family protein [Nocardioidaceae bacterium]
MPGFALRRALAVLLALVAALTARADDSTRELAPATPYTVLQMNLCLSGRAACFPRTRYPAVLDEAARRVRGTGADAVTLAEICSGDVRDLARTLGYAVRFAIVTDGAGRPMPCLDPGGRGVFGNAVLTRSPVTSSTSTRYDAQDGIEDRQVLCVTTRDRVTVCGTHLTVRSSPGELHANDGQCRQLARVLAREERQGPVVAAGDMNRHQPCAPPALWVRDDGGASQSAGLQHAYGDGRFAEPVVRVLPMRLTDHDALAVTARLR